MRERDPRVNPRPGDVLWGAERGTVTVTSLSPRLTVVRCLWPDGMTTTSHYTARRWREFASGLEVVTVAECPFWNGGEVRDAR